MEQIVDAPVPLVVEETSERTVDQLVDDQQTSTPTSTGTRRRFMVIKQTFDHCVLMLDAKKEELEQSEKKETALLARALLVTPREKREWQKVVNES